MKNREEYESLIATASATGGLAFFIGIARVVIHKNHGSTMSFIRGIISSIVVAVLVGWGIKDVGLPLTGQMSIVGVCAYLADDVLLGLLVLGSLFREDPSSFITRLIDAFRGRLSSRSSDDKGTKP